VLRISALRTMGGGAPETTDLQLVRCSTGQRGPAREVA
jgi:hypothetical protein